MSEIQIPDSQQPELDPGLMEVDAQAPIDFSEKIEIVSFFLPFILPIFLQIQLTIFLIPQA